MNNYKKFAAKFCGVELLIIALANIVYYVTANNQEPCISRVQDKTGTIYRIIYTQTDDRTWVLMDIALGILFLLSVFLICYIGKKIIKPFEQMQSLTDRSNRLENGILIKNPTIAPTTANIRYFVR